MLNRLTLNRIYAVKPALAFTIFALLIGFGCGKRKPPLPPVETVSQRIEIAGVQRGSVISLSWTLPDKNASDKSLLNIRRADVYRLAESLSAPAIVSEEEFASRSTLIASITISEADFEKKQFTYSDPLQFAGQPARLRYAIRFVNSEGQKAAFSNFLLIEPTAKSAEQPVLNTAQISQNAISLKWSAPQKNVDGSQPVNILGYNVYRTENKITKTLNDSPVTAENYNDSFFEFGKDYKYFVRTVSLGRDGEPIESVDSNKIAVKPQDTFAPNPPDAITIAAAPNNLSIFFAVNLEKDVVGYKIYRTTDADQPKNEWLLITPEILQRNTFQDVNVKAGETYFYYLTAIDSAGNVSQPSAVVSETAP